MNKIAKQVILSVLFLIFAVLSIYSLKVLLAGDIENTALYVILFLVSLFFSASLLVLLGLGLKLRWQAVVYFLVSGAAFLLFLPLTEGTNISYLIIGTVLFFGLLCWGGKNTKREEEILLEFNFFRVAKKGFGMFFTATAILLAVSFFLSPKMTGGELTLPKPLFNFAWPVVESIFSQQYPGLSGDMTVDEYIVLQKIIQEKDQSSSQNANPLIPFSSDQMDKEKLLKKVRTRKQQIPSQVLKTNRANLANDLGLEKLKGNEEVKPVFYRMISKRIETAIEGYKQLGSLGLIIIFFLLAKAVLSLFSEIVVFPAWLVYKLSIATNFFRTEKVETKKETFVLH